eukprot:TRINITY_DN66967_c13_g1_i1.p1 TRINITY_DN66967_c13_g1~~TRINITY_DN66967_c13_g1_i1.p1  ORF type:complete len:542 (+),score=336.55 TRINITY_DN66967_c13_g1_i1:164-1789(+)
MLKSIKKKFSNKERGGAGSASSSGGGGKSEEKTRRKKKDRSKKSKKSSSSSHSEPLPPLYPEAKNPFTYEDLLKPQPSFQSVSASERPALFVRKLRLCCVTFEWDPVDDMQMPAQTRVENRDEVRAKEVKRQLLLELVEFIGKSRSFIDEAILVELLKMVAANLFRTFPPADETVDPEDEEAVFEPAWPHLQIVYEFFLRFIVSNDVDTKLLKKHINGLFVQHILALFQSEDPRERDYLKTILHRIYAKLMALRAFIRRAINNAFFVLIYETDRHNGVAELLEILGSIINGFALPLKKEHKAFLRRVLIPLHKVRPLPVFHQQLSYCVTQFISKDAELAVPVVKGLVKFWPVTNSNKEVLFLNELEEVLELTQPEEFKQVMVPLFKQLCSSIGSPHFQVAERALFLWHNEYISSLIADNKETLLPILFPVLHTNSQSHWNPTVNNLTVNVMKIFMDMDPDLVTQCSHNYTTTATRRESERSERDQKWDALKTVYEAPAGNDDAASSNGSASARSALNGAASTTDEAASTADESEEKQHIAD